MARSRGFMSKHEDDSAHGNRPWVYFMIDSFFLVTQFFVLTFHVKADEKVLPQQMPPGGTHAISTRTLPPSPTLPVHVMRKGSSTIYRIQTQEFNLDELDGAMLRSAGAGIDYTVRVSYESSVPFGDVMAVFNASKKAGIAKCGLVRLHQDTF